jgi:hypothetical protein
MFREIVARIWKGRTVINVGILLVVTGMLLAIISVLDVVAWWLRVGRDFARSLCLDSMISLSRDGHLGGQGSSVLMDLLDRRLDQLATELAFSNQPVERAVLAAKIRQLRSEMTMCCIGAGVPYEVAEMVCQKQIDKYYDEAVPPTSTPVPVPEALAKPLSNGETTGIGPYRHSKGGLGEFKVVPTS